MHPFTYNRIRTEYWKLSAKNKENADKNQMFINFCAYNYFDHNNKIVALTKLTENFGKELLNYLYSLNKNT